MPTLLTCLPRPNESASALAKDAAPLPRQRASHLPQSSVSFRLPAPLTFPRSIRKSSRLTRGDGFTSQLYSPCGVFAEALSRTQPCSRNHRSAASKQPQPATACCGPSQLAADLPRLMNYSWRLRRRLGRPKAPRLPTVAHALSPPPPHTPMKAHTLREPMPAAWGGGAPALSCIYWSAPKPASPPPMSPP